MNLDQIVDKIRKREYFSYVRLLHGLWERLYYVSQPPRTIDSIKSDIYNAAKIPTPEMAYPPYDHEFWKAQNLRMLDNYLIELLDMIGQPGHVMWGVGTSGFEGQTFGHEQSQEILSLFKDRTLYNGYVWKNSFINGTIVKFLREIQDKHVVVIGMHHLRYINKYLHFTKFKFYPIEMPLEHRRNKMVNDWITFHQQFNGEEVVYLTQLSVIGTWIISKIDDRLKNAYIFDMGRSLDFWIEDRPPQIWDKEIPLYIKNQLMNLNESLLYT